MALLFKICGSDKEHVQLLMRLISLKEHELISRNKAIKKNWKRFLITECL